MDIDEELFDDKDEFLSKGSIFSRVNDDEEESFVGNIVRVDDFFFRSFLLEAFGEVFGTSKLRVRLRNRRN